MQLLFCIITLSGGELCMRYYLCIDFKTFYASVECVERGLDPYKVNLVVADISRGKSTICLAVSPHMKGLGVKNRCRLFEIPKHIHYIVAKPRMKLYMEYSANIYGLYLKYLSQEDIYVYSIDEAFLDVTEYLNFYHKNAQEIAQMIIDDVYRTTGIPATCGIGTNLYLAKVALDITAKHVKSHMAYLDEQIYQKTLWEHTPLTDFWQVGRGIAKRLYKLGIVNMKGIAHCPEDILYKEFGVNARFLIRHAWGKEPVTIQQIKNYQPQHRSISNGQVLFGEYRDQDALLVLKEMVEDNVLTLVEQGLVTNHISLHIRYVDASLPSTGGSRKISVVTNSYRLLVKEFIDLFESTTFKSQKIRKISIGFGQVIDERYEAYDLFTDYEEVLKERQLQQSIIQIKNKYGKNAVLKAMNVLDKATAKQRHQLIGGHNAE